MMGIVLGNGPSGALSRCAYRLRVGVLEASIELLRLIRISDQITYHSAKTVMAIVGVRHV